MNEILRELKLKKPTFMIGITMYIIGASIWLYSLINEYLDGFNIALIFMMMSSNLTLTATSDRIKELEDRNRRLKNIVERSSDE
jgi:hypothetical protein